MNNVISTKIACLYRWSVQPRWEKNDFITIGSQLGNFQQILNFLFFYQHSQPLYDVKQKAFENPEFVQGINFEIIDSLKNSDTKYLLVHVDSYEGFCNAKSFIDFAAAERHHGLGKFSS